jgi:signal transduction histidine kinase
MVTWIEFKVADTGTGISPDIVPKLFSPYTQAKLSTVRLHGGTGLGLAICRQIANYMQGYIKLKSEIGIGSSFIVLLPLEIGPSMSLSEVSM